MDYSCPSCGKSLRITSIRGVSRWGKLIGKAADNDGYCNYCDAPLKRNTHDAEAGAGAITFPALIFAVVCIVLFAYLEYEWLLILAICVVPIALVYEYLMIKQHVPPEWRRWNLGSSETSAVTGTTEFPVVLIVTGGLWICVSIAAAAMRWPKIDWWSIAAALIGVSSIVLGVVRLRKGK